MMLRPSEMQTEFPEKVSMSFLQSIKLRQPICRLVSEAIRMRESAIFIKTFVSKPAWLI
jgi:hypothetical protein